MLPDIEGLGGGGATLLRVWVGGGDVNVIVNLLTPCMLRDTQGFGGGDVNVIVNMGAAALEEKRHWTQ